MIPQPVTRPIPHLGCWETAEPLRVDVDGHTIYVPAGFRTDFGSSPQFSWSIIGHPATPSDELAFVTHDLLYFWGPKLGVTREQSDRIMRRLLRRQHAKWVTAKYLAVRLLGFAAWYQHVDNGVARVEKIKSKPRRVACKIAMRLMRSVGWLTPPLAQTIG